MKTKLLAKIIPIILVLIIMFSLTSCGLDFTNKYDPIDSSKDEILNSVEQSTKEDENKHSYVYKYLIDWGITGFDSTKMRYFEGVFSTYYNLEDGLPAPLTHAQDTAKCFIENFYDEIDLTNYTEVTDAILKCYVYSVGDPYSYYRTAEEFEDFEEDMSGTFVGVGIQVEYNSTEETILVNQVFKDGPADKGGMKVGDYIVGVDSKTLDELGGYLNAIYHIRGEVGTDVIVRVSRDGEIMDLTMTREKITELTVEYELTDEGYGYISITSFKENTAEQFRAAVEALEDLGAKGYIFDVRSNPGGYVSSVVDVMSYILPTDKIVISYEYKNSPKEYEKTVQDPLPEDEGGGKGDHVINLPIVVLCNEYTASAGEIFVACLRDYEAANVLDEVIIVGETTFGKGIMQGSVSYLGDDSYVTLTVAYYNPPSGVNYHGIGITPDVEVELDEAVDTQLLAAIREMDEIFGTDDPENPDDGQGNTPQKPVIIPFKDGVLGAMGSTLANDTYNYTYVTQYLIQWGIKNFDTYKMSYYENVFMVYYNLEDGLPATLSHAADTVNYFFDNYYDKVDMSDYTALTDALLNSYVYTVGDAYSYYRTAEEFADFEEDMSGTFGGVGVQVEYNHTEKTILVNQVFKDGPADKGGMKVGDYVIGVDGMTFEEMGGYLNVVYYIRGEIGTDVVVTVDRDGEILDLTMTREQITEYSVEYELTDEGYGYIRINSFKANTGEQFRAAVEALEDLGATAYIFDVRSNPGGYVFSVVEVMSYILPTGKNVISYQYKGQNREFEKTLDDPLPEDEGGGNGDHVIDLPFVVLCDEYTASAGEIFVACLRDYEATGLIDDVVIVGQNTFGKGIMQGSVGYMNDKSYVTLTVSYYNPPSGVNYHGIGIAADVLVELGEVEDTQLIEAIRQMNLLIESK